MDNLANRPLPNYAELLQRTDTPPGAAWGLWGKDDELGAFNLLTPERVRAATGLVRRGAVFSLNWDLDLPNPALGTRGKARHHVFARYPWGRDDVADNLYLHGSSHWDAFCHFAYPERGFYNGVQPDQITGQPGTRNGIEQVAKRGVVGRGVLLDVGRYFARHSRVFDYAAASPITVADLEATRREQGVKLETGDVLLVRTGWMAFYLEQPQPWRNAVAHTPTIPGLAAGPDMFAYLWDHHVAAVAADNYAVEVFPFQPGGQSSLHANLLGLLGMALGEFFDLEALAEDCQQDGVFEFLFTSAPLNLLGGTGSPPNALAVK
jgi:kynurenine formamidase